MQNLPSNPAKARALIRTADFQIASLPATVKEAAKTHSFYAAIQRTANFISRLIIKLSTRLQIQGKENLDNIPAGPLLIVANHKSFLDPFLIGYCFPFYSKVFPLRFIAKDPFFKFWPGRIIFRLLGAFPAFKGQGLEKSLEIPMRILENGGTVVFFPEGKRIKNEQLGEPKIGAAALLYKFPDVPVLPMAISGAHKIGRFGLLYKKTRLRLSIGKSFTFKEITSRNSIENSVQALMNEISTLYKNSN